MRGIWRSYAICARYGSQPISELRNLTERELRWLREELIALVSKEPALTLA